jgi:hypothetical protein
MDMRWAMELANTQHGLITRAQALGLGMTVRRLEYRITDRVFVPVHEEVYRSAGAPETRAQRLLAACLAVGEPSGVSHRAAAAVHQIWWMPDDFVEITVGRDRSPELVGVTVHRIADLSARWIVQVDGVPVTTPARTLVDLGAVLPLGAVSTALDRAIGRKLVTYGEVRAVLNAVGRKGRAGAGVIRRLLAQRLGRGPAPNGVLHARMARLVHRNALPEPVQEHTVLDDHGQFVGQVDFAYPELKYAIEVDGYEMHSSPRAFTHDRARQNDLVDLGWTVHRFTWDDVERHPGRVANRIRRRHTQLLGTLAVDSCG